MDKLIRFPVGVVDEVNVVSRLRGDSFTAVIRDYVRRGLEEDRDRLLNERRLTELDQQKVAV